MEKKELKFRAWNGKEMIYQGGFCFNQPQTPLMKNSCEVLIMEGIESGEIIYNGADENCIIMQFTGLYDNNAKEIYNGDILKFVGGTCEIIPCGIYNYQHYKKDSILVVQHLPSGFTLCNTRQIERYSPNEVGKVDNYFFWNHQRSFEVIGNIYENNELLEIGGN